MVHDQLTGAFAQAVSFEQPWHAGGGRQLVEEVDDGVVAARETGVGDGVQVLADGVGAAQGADQGKGDPGILVLREGGGQRQDAGEDEA